ncbi:MAG: ethanolamine ammonia-lyase reactivating factor EutA [Candidatus Thorarchaeota archaeon]|nr:ethanolamine ammonia-lyase reactivating factor EutA [Candidatus Thorarchaeota archaeon]
MFVKTNRKWLTSVGIDIGSSTSHIVFSKLLLEKDPASSTEKFMITERKIIHSGPIHLTPFSDPDTVDLEKLTAILAADYESAGINTGDIDTGAVIITGETAKKHNAETIVEEIAGEAGAFVAATAGPNFESVLAAHGSGAISRSEAIEGTVMNIDIGGGSSNIAVCRNGRVIDTAAINVGGRLVATDSAGVITRLEDIGKELGKHLGIELELSKRISEEKKMAMADELADTLFDCLTGKLQKPLTKDFLMTEPLDITTGIEEVTFSGGVAEYIYDIHDKTYNDLGAHLGNAIKERIPQLKGKFTRPAQTIRATVIGAGQASLEVSGSSTFLSADIEYPIRNLPIVVPHIPSGRPTEKEIAAAIRDSLARFDIVEGEQQVALAFNGTVKPSYDHLTTFSKGVVSALEKTVEKHDPILMVFSNDVGNSVGNVMRRETGIENQILSIDEISVQEGDFIDIGEPVIENAVVPVIIKKLVFA